jgi:hypothetical protein
MSIFPTHAAASTASLLAAASTDIAAASAATLHVLALQLRFIEILALPR